MGREKVEPSTLHLRLPGNVREAAERQAAAAGVSVTVWIGRLIAAATGVQFEPRGRGRPRAKCD